MTVCVVAMDIVIVAEQMLVAVQDGLVVNVEYGIVVIVRKMTKTLVRNVDLRIWNQTLRKKLRKNDLKISSN
jgi:hypothetical protein